MKSNFNSTPPPADGKDQTKDCDKGISNKRNVPKASATYLPPNGPGQAVTPESGDGLLAERYDAIEIDAKKKAETSTGGNEEQPQNNMREKDDDVKKT